MNAWLLGFLGTVASLAVAVAAFFRGNAYKTQAEQTAENSKRATAQQKIVESATDQAVKATDHGLDLKEDALEKAKRGDFSGINRKQL